MIKQFMLVLAVMLVGCKSEGNAIPYNDAKLEGIRGRVKAVTEVIRLSDSNVVSQRISLYDENGNKISMESLDNELDTELLEFSSNGILKYEPYKGQQRVLKGYDYEGTVLSEAIQKWSSSENYTIVTVYHNTPLMSNKIKGIVDKEGKVSSVQMMVKNEEGEQMNSSTKILYDAQGYQSGYNQLNGISVKEEEYEVINGGYDNYGNVTKRSIYTIEGELMSEIMISYDYYN